MQEDSPSLCVVILTRNRQERCRKTVTELSGALKGLNASILIVNNGGETVGSLDFAETATPVTIINNSENRGTSARNQAISAADLLLFLDDDAVITRKAITQAVGILTESESVGAVSFRISDDKGSEEACLLPSVFHGCACCLRADALRRVGGYPKWMDYYGEEYDVAFGLYDAGYEICMIGAEDSVTHFRHPGGRDLNSIIQRNILHNTTTWSMRFPWHYIVPAISDTLQRYRLVAHKEKSTGCLKKARRMIPFALLKGIMRRKPISLNTFRRILLLDSMKELCRKARSAGIDTLSVAGVGKFPSLYLQEIRAAGLTVPFFFDMNPCWNGASIDDVPVITSPSTTPADCRKMIADTPGHAILVGASSIPEALAWTKAAQADGMRPICESSWATNAESGSISLLDDQPMMIMSPPLPC